MFRKRQSFAIIKGYTVFIVKKKENQDMKNSKKAILAGFITAFALITMSFTAFASPRHHNTSSRDDYSTVCSVCGTDHSDDDGYCSSQGRHGCGRGNSSRHQSGGCYYRTE